MYETNHLRIVSPRTDLQATEQAPTQGRCNGREASCMRPDIVPSLIVLPLAPVPARLHRGVHAFVEQPSGETVYAAITSTGALLNDELRRRFPDENEAFIARDLWRDLDRQDPVIARPRLSLVVGGAPPRSA
jgi:hypothetical protein